MNWQTRMELLFLFPFWAAAPKGTESCRTEGESVRLFVRLSVCPYVHPPLPHPQGLSPLGPILTQILPNSLNPSNMAQIYAKWPKSKHNGRNPSIMAQIWSESRYWRPHVGLRGQNDGPQARIEVFWQDLANLLGFRPFCLNLGHYAWIFAILLRFGPYCLD